MCAQPAGNSSLSSLCDEMGNFTVYIAFGSVFVFVFVLDYLTNNNTCLSSPRAYVIHVFLFVFVFLSEL